MLATAAARVILAAGAKQALWVIPTLATALALFAQQGLSLQTTRLSAVSARLASTPAQMPHAASTVLPVSDVL